MTLFKIRDKMEITLTMQVISSNDPGPMLNVYLHSFINLVTKT